MNRTLARPLLSGLFGSHPPCRHPAIRVRMILGPSAEEFHTFHSLPSNRNTSSEEFLPAVRLRSRTGWLPLVGALRLIEVHGYSAAAGLFAKKVVPLIP